MRSVHSGSPPRTVITAALTFSVVLHVSIFVAVVWYAGGFHSPVPPGNALFVETMEPLISKTARPTLPLTAPQVATPAPPLNHLQSPPAPQAENAAEQPPQAPPAAEIMSSPLGLGMTYGYVRTLADGTTLREDIKRYYFEMVEKINHEWWLRAATLKEPIRQDGIVEVLLQRDGVISARRIRQTTGSRDSDRVLLEALDAASPLPALPESYESATFQAPLRIAAPSTLFRLEKRR